MEPPAFLQRPLLETFSMALPDEFGTKAGNTRPRAGKKDPIGTESESNDRDTELFPRAGLGKVYSSLHPLAGGREARP